MAAPNKKLAEALKSLRAIQKKNITAINTNELTRSHREQLLASGYILEIIKGWYIISNPGEKKGDSTLWYSSFWNFCSGFLDNRYKKKWCISPEQSVSLHSGNFSIPNQLIIKSPDANNTKTNLPFNTSLFNLKASLPGDDEMDVKEGIRMYSKASALINCGEVYFRNNPGDARTVLSAIRDASEILAYVLPGGNTTKAGRLAGAFRNIGSSRIADDIIKTLKGLKYDIREEDPFSGKSAFIIPVREKSPYANRITLMWYNMRETVIKYFPEEKKLPADTEKYMKLVQDKYVTDAYHSLSIEGYRVSADLIERVANGSWNPESDTGDRDHKNALAALGYWEAFQSVKKSIKMVLKGRNPGKTADLEHGNWYRKMFSPQVTAGILKAYDLAGYRNARVYISKSAHVPLNHSAVRDAMPAFFELLKKEKNPAVRVVLGNFIFVYIHPYMDGNGRIARFLMNVMLASGGYPWTVIPVEQRDKYMDSLEQASVHQNIKPFTKFLAKLVKAGLSGKPTAKKL